MVGQERQDADGGPELDLPHGHGVEGLLRRQDAIAPPEDGLLGGLPDQ